MSETARARYRYQGQDMNAIVGRRIHMVMWDRGETQTKVAPLLGMTQTNFSKRLNGKHAFDLNEIRWLCDYLEIDIDWLLRAPEPGEQHVGVRHRRLERRTRCLRVVRDDETARAA